MKRHLHIKDNSALGIKAIPKAFKITPLYKMQNRRCIQLCVFSKQLSIDDQMGQDYGRHSLKQFIRGKLIRFGKMN